MKIVFFAPLGLCIDQAVVPKKCAVWQAIGAGISALGSLVGNQMQNNANANLNETNRSFQWAMLNKQQEFSKEMWNKENAYNTPLQQRERLREAGYNPWASGSGGPMSNVSANVTSAGSAPAPSTMPMRYDNPFANLPQVINDAVRSDAESANQLSQAAQNGVNTAIALYEKTGDFEAAQEYLSTVLRSIGGANMSDDSMYFRQLNLAILGKELENDQLELQNIHQELENGLLAKFGEAKASALIANLEQLTTKYVGELGLMSSQVDLNRSEINLNRSEIKLNMDKAYELGARAAREFSESGLLTSETKLNDGVRNFLIGNAKLGYYQNKMDYIENKATFDSRKSIRDWKVTPDSQSRQLWNYKQSPEGNYVNSFLNGFTNSANVSFGGNYNFNRSKSDSFTRGINDTRVTNMNQLYQW